MGLLCYARRRRHGAPSTTRHAARDRERTPTGRRGRADDVVSSPLPHLTTSTVLSPHEGGGRPGRLGSDDRTEGACGVDIGASGRWACRWVTGRRVGTRAQVRGCGAGHDGRFL